MIALDDFGIGSSFPGRHHRKDECQKPRGRLHSCGQDFLEDAWWKKLTRESKTQHQSAAVLPRSVTNSLIYEASLRSRQNHLHTGYHGSLKSLARLQLAYHLHH